MKKTLLTYLSVMSIPLLIYHLITWNVIFKKGIETAYQNGLEEGKRAVNLEDVCIDMEPAGFAADFEKGISFDWVRCKTSFKYGVQVEDVFEFEGDWDKCDENGENCRPFTRNSQKVMER